MLAEVWPPPKPGDTAGCTVLEAAWNRVQKEARIIDTLEPVMSLHRLVVDERVARDQDAMYQLTHITKDRGSLAHDDRIDALAGAVAHFTTALALDTNSAAKAMSEQEALEALEEFVEAFKTMGSSTAGRAVQKGRNGEPVYCVRV
jgi:2,4-dienoyl-CoA reductase-like NADH-dependent reductase (Old Yellow Enzyme family)